MFHSMGGVLRCRGLLLGSPSESGISVLSGGPMTASGEGEARSVVGQGWWDSGRCRSVAGLSRVRARVRVREA